MADSVKPHRPEFGPINLRPRRSIAMHADDHWASTHWYEAPREDPALPEVHSYTDAISYAAGEEVSFRSSTTAKTWSLQIYRDGLSPEIVHEADDLPGLFTPAPKDAYKAGCGWPVRHRWRLPADLRPGFYRVVSSCARADGSRFVQHHFFVLRPMPRTSQPRLLMLLPTATWTAYNDWGGANSYVGIDGAGRDQASPILSLERPWTRGTVWLPEGAPRICAERAPEPWSAPRYPMKEWAFSNGFGQYYAASGWAQYDRHFAVWAEAEGYDFDIITQTDLQFRPEILEGYRCVVIIGHDEYWSREMRVAIEGFVEAGGRVARLAANFVWQIRLESEGRRQVCYKFRAPTEDPLRGTDRAHLLTSAWEDPTVNWPGAATFGVNGARGLYASWGGFLPRGQKGFTVYRPAHWVFDKTDLSYGDVFGAEAQIFAYEVDGLDYTFRSGLPFPTGADGAPPGIEILAMSPAVLAETCHDGEGFRYYIKDSDLRGVAKLVTGGEAPENLDQLRYGAGMLVHMTRGRGEVVTAGSCEWVMGLKRKDFFTQQVTRNILDRFIAD
jgi:hypothetical protein